LFLRYGIKGTRVGYRQPLLIAQSLLFAQETPPLLLWAVARHSQESRHIVDANSDPDLDSSSSRLPHAVDGDSFEALVEFDVL
jgi:hypothetical protein